MPTYEYRCTRCDEQFEVYQSFQDEPLKRHRGCGGKLNKVFGSVGIVLRGPGFYRTDSRGDRRGGGKDRDRTGAGADTASGDGSGSPGSSGGTSSATGTAKSAASS